MIVDCIAYGEHFAHKLRICDNCTHAIIKHCIKNIPFETEVSKYFDGTNNQCIGYQVL
jgi:hypothetical protein